MKLDGSGLWLTTDIEAAAQGYDAALVDMMEYRLSLGDRVKAILDVDPQFVMGHVLRGTMLAMLASNVVAGKVAETIAGIEKLGQACTARERRHVAALKAWANGYTAQAMAIWQEIVVNHPGDLLALRLHHYHAFWRGERGQLRALPEYVLARGSLEQPGAGFVLSMAAFGAEESGDYRTAEDYGRRAVERNRDDLWGIHAVAHVMEMEGRHEDGLAWLAQPEDAWTDRNPFQDHIWWHRGLFLLEEGRIAEVIELFDRKVDIDERGFYLDVQNAASLLMRLRLAGVDVGKRWDKLARVAVQRTGDHVLAFTDAHFALALVAARRFEEARGYLASQKTFGKGDSDAAVVTREVGVALTEALIAYGEGRDDAAVTGLMGVREQLARLGGSHAQQDIFTEVLIDAAERAGQKVLARSLLSARAELMLNSRWGQARLAALGTGDDG